MCMCVFPACMSVLHMHASPLKGWGRVLNPLDWSCGLGTKLGSSGSVLGAVNRLAISPAPKLKQNSVFIL